MKKYTCLEARGLGSVVAALLLSCTSSTALCGADCEDGHSDIPQFFSISVLKLCADIQWASLCCFGLVSSLTASGSPEWKVPRNCYWRLVGMVSVAVFGTLSAYPGEATPAKLHGMDERHPSFFCGACCRSSA